MALKKICLIFNC